MKKLIIGVLMVMLILGACSGCGIVHEHTKLALSIPGENETYVYDYIDGELQSVTTIKHVVLQENEAV